MAEKVPSPHTLGNYHVADASLVATKRMNLPNCYHKLTTPIRTLYRCANKRFASQDPLPLPNLYHYTPLNDDLNEIRLLTLHEGKFQANIRISIHSVPLNPDNPPTYEALSYVWGSPETSIDIQVGLRSLAITKNLAEALPYLRYEDKPRVLWIDAICVNQQDLTERSRQVKRMADLYRLADRVVVWLGPEEKESGHGLRVMEELSSQINVDWLRSTMEPRSDHAAQHWSGINQGLPYDERSLRAIYSLISYPWFERLWIWQEIHLANSSAVLMCGCHTILWTSFRMALFCLSWKTHGLKRTSIVCRPLSARLINIYPLAVGGLNTNVVNIMNRTKDCKYTDPRDRIYAVLSLLKQAGEAIRIEPDYTKRPGQVYQDLTLSYIKYSGNLNILVSSGLNYKRSEMPTWVTDWTVVNTPTPFLKAGASGDCKNRCQYRGAGSLNLTGILSATVQHVDRVESRSMWDLIAEIQRIAPHSTLHDSYTGGGSLLTAYCKTICANEFSETFLPPVKMFSQFQESLDFLSAILQPDERRVLDYSPGTRLDVFLARVRSYCKNRSFIKTSEGYIGLAPENAQLGDLICVFRGCRTLMLIRLASDSRYQVVGSCYVHGHMDGEAVLGPLPEHYRIMSVLDERLGTYKWGFEDQRTRRIQFNDPRLDLISADNDGEVVTNPDGSESQCLTVKMLEERGVPLQTFDLV